MEQAGCVAQLAAELLGRGGLEQTAELLLEMGENLGSRQPTGVAVVRRTQREVGAEVGHRIGGDVEAAVMLHHLLLVLIALRDDIRYQVCYTDSYVHHGGARSHIPESMINPDEPDFERRYGAECANAMIKAGRDAGYFVTYNHPSWSQENWSHYMKLEGLSAMEIVNFGCLNEGYDDYKAMRDILNDKVLEKSIILGWGIWKQPLSQNIDGKIK